MFIKKRLTPLLVIILLVMTMIPVATAASLKALPSGNLIYFERDGVGYISNFTGTNQRPSGGRYMIHRVESENGDYNNSTGALRAHNDPSWEKYLEATFVGLNKTYSNVDECTIIDMVGNWVYAFVYPYDNSTNTDTVRVNRNTSAVQKLAVNISMPSGEWPSEIAVDGDYVYYYVHLQKYTNGKDTSTREFYRLGISTKKITKLATVDGGSTDYNYAVYLVNNHIYYMKKNGDIARVPKDGGAEKILIQNINPKPHVGIPFYVGDSKGLKQTPINSLSMPGELTLEVGANVYEFALLATKPNTSQSTNDITWTFSNTGIVERAKHDAEANYYHLYARKVGSTTITVKASSGKSAKCKVNVTEAASRPVTSMELHSDNVSGWINAVVSAGKTVTLKFSSIKPSNHNSKLMWWSEDGNVATVDQNGIVKGVSKGEVRIRCISSSGVSASAYVVVN